MTEIDEYNPFPSFRAGQKEAITEILDLYDAREPLVELNAPTAAGKSLDLFVVGQVLAHEYGIGRIVYTTPLVALVNQLRDTEMFSSMPVLKGKRNYPCDLMGRGLTAEDCPFSRWDKAMKFCRNREGQATDEQGRPLATPCGGCEYQHKRKEFMDASFGATTLARYMVDYSIRGECSVLLIDESSGLEKTLVDRATLVLPDEVDIKNLRESITAYAHKISAQIDELSDRLTDTENGSDTITKEMVDGAKKKNQLERIHNKCIKIIAHIDNDDKYMIDAQRKFRLLEGRSELIQLMDGVDMIVLASGTPTTEVFDVDYKTVTTKHPIPPDRRRCCFQPVGLMNYKERSNTAPKMAQEIEALHNKHHKKTIVHCGAYVIADMLYKHLSPKAKRMTILQDRESRERSKESFLCHSGERIFLSVNFGEGLDLVGPDYPLNIIAKVPFENIGDEWIKHRNAHDRYMRYNLNTAVAVMQAAGRCTRSVDDYSETYILDSSWKMFYARSRKLFQPWFVVSLDQKTPQRSVLDF